MNRREFFKRSAQGVAASAAISAPSVRVEEFMPDNQRKCLNPCPQCGSKWPFYRMQIDRSVNKWDFHCAVCRKEVGGVVSNHMLIGA